MAVVQISRIQIRRGQKNSQTGFPQLASGELGWAIDTQELYIGNGAVSEGAPYVGNSKILTEHDNLLDFATLYQYRKSDPTIQTGDYTYEPIQRSLQDRLDDIVSIKSFGAVGDGETDDTDALQRAFDQLFLINANTNSQKREILYIDPGTYLISDELRVSEYAHITGAGIDSTTILQTGDCAVMRMISSNSTPGNYIDFLNENITDSPSRPKYIHIGSLTLATQTAYPILYADNLDSSIFERIKFLGVWPPAPPSPLPTGYTNTLPATQPSPNQNYFQQVGIYLRGTSNVLRSKNVLFHSCIIQGTGIGVYSDELYGDSLDITFDQCTFYQLYDAINIGGGVFGSGSSKVTNSYFDLIDRYGIWIRLGGGNISLGNTFQNVGCNSQGYTNAIYPIIKFDTANNKSTGDYFERSTRLKDYSLFGTIPFIPNITDVNLYQDQYGRRTTINESSFTYVAIRLPVYTIGVFVIDYIINKTTNGNALRTGKMKITIGSIVNTTTFHMIDDYSYTGSSTVENIIFSTVLEDKNIDGLVDTMSIYVLNPLDTVPSTGGGNATLNYSYYTLSK